MTTDQMIKLFAEIRKGCNPAPKLDKKTAAMIKSICKDVSNV